MTQNEHVWVFSGAGAKFPAGVFTTKERAGLWIARYRLTGVLTSYPLDEGTFDWAVANEHFRVDNERARLKASDPLYVGSFSSAAQAHHHYSDGQEC